jgi:hypothetical protein
MGKIFVEPPATAQPVDATWRLAFPTAATARSAARPHDGRPSGCGDFDIRIARDGTWFYHGSPINRKPLVRLFSTVLQRAECGDFMLVTPAERGRIAVEDAPFTAVALDVAGSGRDQMLTFTTNVDDRVTAGRGHPIRVAADAATGDPSPYVLVRPGLEARIARAIFYELADRSIEAPAAPGRLGVWSDGVFFDLGPAA